MRRAVFRAASLTMLLAVLPWDGSLRAQSAAGKPAPSLIARLPGSRDVVLDAVLPKGEREIAPGKLVVADNGERVPPDALQVVDAAGAAPVQLLLVVDAINETQADLLRVEAAVGAFLRERAGALLQPTSVVFLMQSPPAERKATQPAISPKTAVLERRLSVHRLPPSMDGKQLAVDFDQFAKVVHIAHGAETLVSERVRMSLEALSFLARAEADVPGAKVTLWLSPGWPLIAQSSARSSPQLFDSVVYFSDALRNARMLLYMLDPEGVSNQSTAAEDEAFLLASRGGSSPSARRTPDVPVNLGQDYYKSLLRGVRVPGEANPNHLTLQVLAVQSGGEVLQQNNDLRGMVEQCARDTGRLLSVRYQPERGNGGLLYHSIVVKENGKSEPLRARAGFYTR